MQIGGIRAVAMATPGTILFASFFLEPMKPAIPPAIAMRTSQMVGEVRAINSLLKDEFDRGLHALSLRAKTPAEVEKEAAVTSGIAKS